MTEPLSYTPKEAAAATGISEAVIRRAHRDGELEFRYRTSHPVILRAELERWLEAAPTERKTA